jgi:lipoic acid synthetase
MQKKPDWLKVKYWPASQNMRELIEKYNLHSVCQSAHCPNCSECWSSGTATFMVLGDQCTRNCRFCSVETNPRPETPDPKEPDNLAAAIKELKLKYIVLTSVDRDDLPDFGASHFAKCIKAIKDANPEIRVEALVPDFQNNENAIRIIVNSGADVLGHNIETVERLTQKVRDARASYEQSLEVLHAFKKLKTQDTRLKTKSSIMLGLGETRDEIIASMKDLLEAKVDILTLGQYLQPTKAQLKVERFVPPEEFKEYEEIGRDLGFQAVFAGPFVRSSYKAAELFLSKHL